MCLSDICTKAQAIEPQVSEYVELMSILSRTAGFPEYSMNMAGQYTADIDSCFRKHADHPAVLQMKELRRKHGIAYDAVMSMAVHLKYEKEKFTLLEEEENTLEKRWVNVDKTNFLALLSDFYHDTGFHKFFSEHAGLYNKGLQSYKENVMKGFDRHWYSEFYGKEPKEHFSVVIGFCNGGGNYGSDRHPKGEKKKYLQ